MSSFFLANTLLRPNDYTQRQASAKSRGLHSAVHRVCLLLFLTLFRGAHVHSRVGIAAQREAKPGLSRAFQHCRFSS